MRRNRSIDLTFLLLLCCVIAARPAWAEEPLRSGIDRANFDLSVAPGQDFFEYVDGNWVKHNPIPPDHSGWGAFAELHDRNLLALREILEELQTAGAAPDEDRRKLRDFYRTAMDEKLAEDRGLGPVARELREIAGIRSRDDLVKLIAREHAAGLNPMFDFSVGQDEKASTRYIVHLYQGGIALPERDYYVGEDADSRRIRSEYHVHVAKMLQLMGDSAQSAQAEADAVVAIETELARASRTPVQLRDVEAQYNKKTVSQLGSLTPFFDWKSYLAVLGRPQIEEVIVGQPEFFQRLDRMLVTVSIEHWQSYLRWNLIHSTAPYLADKFADEDFRFFGAVLNGEQQIQPRWKRAVRAIDQLMGEALGRLYVQKHFGPEARKRMADMVENLIVAYRRRIESRDWMAPQTKQSALAKLRTTLRKIGYPDKWRDYSALQIGADSYAQNVLRARSFEFHYWLAKLGQPVDRGEWGMSTPTVNAYYDASMNQIVFPAGILQPPFFDPQADDAVNYGGIGSIIGHELTHGFDDQGCLFDAEGNLRNWWTEQDKSRFKARAQRVCNQFDACVAIDDLHVNGRLTLGENIADLGGVTIALSAYRRSLGDKPAPVIDGFTGEQRFFIGWAQVWRGHTRPEALRVDLRTDPHSPYRFRVNVPLSNLQAFCDAFNIKPGDAMYRPPEQRAEVW